MNCQMNEEKAKKEWVRQERMLDYKEIAFLSENALGLRDLMNCYKVGEPSDPITAEALDVVFAEWIEDESSRRMPAEDLILVLGISFGNYLCESLSMQWIELTDSGGTTYAVRHEKAEVYCFPIESVKKRVESGELGFFAGIEAAARQDIENDTTRQRD